ncbi:MAG: zinc-binding alcohol dehydrogenase family protein [Massilia sp.]
MQAIVLRQHGAWQNLLSEEVALPTPGSGQLRIKVESASVNYADIVRRRNDPYPLPTTLPAVLGGEVAGTIDALGAGVDASRWAPGTRVFALLPSGGIGGYAQYALADAGSVIPIPAELDFDIACTLVVAGVTAYQTLNEAGRLEAGDSVFIPGASGGVGAYAVQLAKLLGAGTVIAGASTAEKRAQAISAGADHAVDYTAKDWPGQVKALTGGRGADVILEMAGGPFFNESLEALAPFGRLVVYGTASRERSNLVPQALLGPCQAVVGYYVGHWFTARKDATLRDFDILTNLILSGKLKVEIGARLPLRMAGKAHEIMETRQANGKIVLKPWADL